jgi:hypothetical protein
MGDDRRMTVTTAGELQRIAEGREAEIFAWEPGVVLKLYRMKEWARSRDIERAAMEAVLKAGGPAPAAKGTVEIDGRPGLLMERVEGIDMLTELGTKPWTIARTGSVVGRVQAALNETRAPDGIETLKD